MPDLTLNKQDVAKAVEQMRESADTASWKLLPLYGSWPSDVGVREICDTILSLLKIIEEEAVGENMFEVSTMGICIYIQVEDEDTVLYDIEFRYGAL